MPKLVRNTYTISIPTEAFSDEAALCNAAIDQARERARKYVMPAGWTAWVVGHTADDTLVRVIRYHRRVPKTA